MIKDFLKKFTSPQPSPSKGDGVGKSAPTRDGFGRALLELGEKDSRVVVLCADLAESTRTLAFKEKYPTRYIEIGVAEQNLAAVAAGLAAYGKIPFIASYAAFSPGRNWEQIRTTACLNNLPVKVMGMHAGVSVGPDGATHQALEDIATMRVIPNMTVIYPCDAIEAHKAVLAAAVLSTPVYIRFAREATPIMTTESTSFEIGKGYEVWRSSGNGLIVDGLVNKPSCAILATGPLLHHALCAAKELEKQGIGTVIANIHTIKPLDEELIEKLARETGAVVTVEEHQVAGGFGSSVAECLARRHPTKMAFVGVQNRFGQSGTPEELLREYKLDTPAIVDAVLKIKQS